jgi:hypothetical protein
MLVSELTDVAIVALSLAIERDRILRTVEAVSKHQSRGGQDAVAETQ